MFDIIIIIDNKGISYILEYKIVVGKKGIIY